MNDSTNDNAPAPLRLVPKVAESTAAEDLLSAARKLRLQAIATESPEDIKHARAAIDQWISVSGYQGGLASLRLPIAKGPKRAAALRDFVQAAAGLLGGVKGNDQSDRYNITEGRAKQLKALADLLVNRALKLRLGGELHRGVLTGYSAAAVEKSSLALAKQLRLLSRGEGRRSLDAEQLVVETLVACGHDRDAARGWIPRSAD